MLTENSRHGDGIALMKRLLIAAQRLCHTDLALSGALRQLPQRGSLWQNRKVYRTAKASHFDRLPPGRDRFSPRRGEMSPNINIEDVTQSILQGMFAMIMLVDITKCNVSHEELHQKMNVLAAEMGMQINLTRQEVFDAMHTI